MAHLNMRLRGGGHTGIEAINYWVARHRNVDIALSTTAGPIYSRAKTIHAANRDQGHSYVGIEKGDVDYYVFLDDDRGADAAMSIEFGHTHPDTGEWVPGMYALTWMGR